MQPISSNTVKVEFPVVEPVEESKPDDVEKQVEIETKEVSVIEEPETGMELAVWEETPKKTVKDKIKSLIKG